MRDDSRGGLRPAGRPRHGDPPPIAISETAPDGPPGSYAAVDRLSTARATDAGRSPSAQAHDTTDGSVSPLSADDGNSSAPSREEPGDSNEHPTSASIADSSEDASDDAPADGASNGNAIADNGLGNSDLNGSAPDGNAPADNAPSNTDDASPTAQNPVSQAVAEAHTALSGETASTAAALSASLATAEEDGPDSANAPESAGAHARSAAPTAAGLVALNAPNASTASHTPDADGWITCGTLRVKGGTYGKDFIYYPEVFQSYREDGTVTSYGFVGFGGTMKSDLVLVLTNKPLTVKNAEGTNTETPAATDAAQTCIYIAPGEHADVTLAGVNINASPNANIPINVMTNVADTATGAWAKAGGEIRNRTSLHLTLADGTKNYFSTLDINTPAIRCGEGSDLTIDDAERNVDQNGQAVTPIGAVIADNVTLLSGKSLRKGDPHTALDSANPGSLEVWGGQQAAAIGGASEETGGTMTFNGGNVTAHAWTGHVMLENGAAIGGGSWGCGTDGVLTFNSGNIDAIGNYHSSGIGSGCGAKHNFNYDYAIAPDHIPCLGRQKGDYGWVSTWCYASNVRAGNITINGGFIKSTGYEHSSGFGNSCASAPNTGGVIRITGGTLYPSVTSTEGFPDFNAEGGHVIITGGSVYTNGSFQGIGDTAWGNDAALAPGYNPDNPEDPNKVFMVTIDVGADLRAAGEDGNNLIENWNLKVGGEDYPYGAPTRLIDGKLYLWLPKSATQQTVSVDLSYRGKDGQPHPFDTLFRNPGQVDQLKRYEDFTLPQEYLDSLVKPYDGQPFKTYEITPEHPLRTPEVLSYDEDGNPSEYRWLTNTDDVSYCYRLYDQREGKPLGDEISSGSVMPRNVGVMKFVMVSREYSGSSDPALADFANGYWGHRATGWCEITPIPSKVQSVTAEWTDETPDSAERPGDAAHGSDQSLTVTALIGRGDTVDGKPLAADQSNATAETCRAPQGRVQLYVDGEPVGKPVQLLFDTKLDGNGDVLMAGGSAVADNPGTANATVVPNGVSGASVRFTYTFKASEMDHLVPGIGDNGRHEVSVRFLPPDETQQKAGAPANYLASAAPDENATVPRAEVVIDPIDPNPTVTPEADPDKKDPDFPEPTVTTGPGEPSDPDADPTKPGDKTFHGQIVTTWGEATEDNPHPGRVTLKVSTPSSGPISVIDATGNVFTADFVRDKETGEPVRGGDGSYTLVLDPTAVGTGTLTFRQEPNGAYTGSTWVYDVKVNPDASVTPNPALTKSVRNLTHPEGPTQPGDRLSYTIVANNKEPGSLWMDVVVSDALPPSLVLDETSVKLASGGKTTTLTKAAAVTANEVGKYALAGPGADGRPVLTVPVGNVGGGSSATVTFECTVRDDLDLTATAPGLLDLANIANATGTRPDPTDPDKPLEDPEHPGEPVPVRPDPTDPVTPPGPGVVVPSDPAAGDVLIAKKVANLTRPTEGVTRIGDKLRYTVTLEHRGSTNSMLYDATISDPLPAGIEPVPGTLQLIGPLAVGADAGGAGAGQGGAGQGGPGGTDPSQGGTGGAGEGQGAATEPIAVPDSAYDTATRTIAVAVGDLRGGQKWELTFECTVGPDAAGADNANVAFAFGTPPSQDPNHNPAEPPTKPGDPAKPPTPGEKPTAKTDPVEPPRIVPDDPTSDDVSIRKTAENTSREGDTTQVGDVIRYEITLANAATGTAWMDAVIRDRVPEGLEPMTATMHLTRSDGREFEVPDNAYDPATRVMAVACGHLYGGQSVTLAFDALVTEDAAGADIGNVAVGSGTPPSEWDPDGDHPEPGTPFEPPEGWDAYDRTHPSVESEPVYPPGVDGNGVPEPDDAEKKAARAKRSATVVRKLAQTGDALAAAALLPVAAMLAAGAAALASRRRLRRTR